jgi:hypothetical protein
LAKTSIGQVLQAGLPKWQGFSECYWSQRAELLRVSLTILYVKDLDVMLLGKTEL